MMNGSGSKSSVRAMGLGLLAVACSAVSVQGARVFCRFVSASRTRIQVQDGYAEALVDIAKTICAEATGEPTIVPIEQSIAAVASAQAEAVAEVVGQCAGDGTATLRLRARRRANARARAVGAASANILASAGVCDLCEIALDSMVKAVETLTAESIAEVDLDARFTFTGEPLTVNVIQRTVETRVASLLATITGEVRASAIDGCSANILSRASTPNTFATCDVSISADDILTERDDVAQAGLELQSFGCDGADSFQEVELKLREVATAVARSVTAADAFCETSGGPGTVACGLTNGTVTAIARANVEAFAQGMVEAVGKECDCFLAVNLKSEELVTVIAESTASSLASVCVEGTDYARDEQFVEATVEKVAEAIAEVFIQTFVGVEECAVNLNLVAEINQSPPVVSGFSS